MKVDWDVWVTRNLADEDIVRLILDGTVIKTRIDKKATNISVLAAIGVRRDGRNSATRASNAASALWPVSIVVTRSTAASQGIVMPPPMVPAPMTAMVLISIKTLLLILWCFRADAGTHAPPRRARARAARR